MRSFFSHFLNMHQNEETNNLSISKVVDFFPCVGVVDGSKEIISSRDISRTCHFIIYFLNKDNA